MLQAGRSRVRFPMSSLFFSIDLILSAVLWSWVRISLWQKWVPGSFLEVKGGRSVRLTSPPSSWADCLESVCEARRLTNLWGSTASYRDSFTITIPPIYFKYYIHLRGERKMGSCYVLWSSHSTCLSLAASQKYYSLLYSLQTLDEMCQFEAVTVALVQDIRIQIAHIINYIIQHGYVKVN
jgi:hypothetical protein